MWPRIPVASRHQAMPDDDSRVVESEYRPGFDRGQTALFFVARLQPAQRDRLTQQVPTALIARVWQSKCDSNGQATWPSARGKMRRRLAGAGSEGRADFTQGHCLVGTATSRFICCFGGSTHWSEMDTGQRLRSLQDQETLLHQRNSPASEGKPGCGCLSEFAVVVAKAGSTSPKA